LLSLLGLAGGAAASIAGWLAPLMIGLSGILLLRAHFLLHVRKRGGRPTAVVTWLATMAVVGFWTWKLVG